MDKRKVSKAIPNIESWALATTSVNFSALSVENGMLVCAQSI